MARLNWEGATPPLQHPEDPLRFVKDFLYGVVLAKLGICRFTRFDAQPDDVKYVYNKVVPALVQAILADDPDFNPDNDWITGKRPPTVAVGTGAVRWFVEIQESAKAIFEMSPDAKASALFERMYAASPRAGCFLDDLRVALMKGDPDWRGPYVQENRGLPHDNR